VYCNCQQVARKQGVVIEWWWSCEKGPATQSAAVLPSPPCSPSPLTPSTPHALLLLLLLPPPTLEPLRVYCCTPPASAPNRARSVALTTSLKALRRTWGRWVGRNRNKGEEGGGGTGRVSRNEREARTSRGQGRGGRGGVSRVSAGGKAQEGC
jgi:hypothetical protein